MFTGCLSHHAGQFLLRGNHVNIKLKPMPVYAFAAILSCTCTLPVLVAANSAGGSQNSDEGYRFETVKGKLIPLGVVLSSVGITRTELNARMVKATKNLEQAEPAEAKPERWVYRWPFQGKSIETAVSFGSDSKTEDVVVELPHWGTNTYTYARMEYLLEFRPCLDRYFPYPPNSKFYINRRDVDRTVDSMLNKYKHNGFGMKGNLILAWVSTRLPSGVYLLLQFQTESNGVVYASMKLDAGKGVYIPSKRYAVQPGFFEERLVKIVATRKPDRFLAGLQQVPLSPAKSFKRLEKFESPQKEPVEGGPTGSTAK